jgi:TPR repeat protein
MRAFDPACSPLRRRAVLAVLLYGCCLPAVSAQQTLSGGSPREATGSGEPSERGSRLDTTGCNLKTVGALANAGEPHEQNQLGTASALVRGPGRTNSDFRKRFEKSAQEGDVSAQLNLAVIYACGWGTPQNYGAALYWLKAAAKQGSTHANTNLGILYLKGLGVKQDYPEALRYFRTAAEAGDPGSMINLGYMNDAGLGMPVDRTAASSWYRRAAEKGDPLGQNNLADLYLRGEGLPQRDDLALAWFQEAAANGNTAARIKLGYMYATGRATQRDAESAYAWLLAAALAGDRRGVDYLPALEAQLRPGQLERAKHRAKELQATPKGSPAEVTFVQ